MGVGQHQWDRMLGSVNSPPILGPILAGIKMFTGTGVLTHICQISAEVLPSPTGQAWASPHALGRLGSRKTHPGNESDEQKPRQFSADDWANRAATKCVGTAQQNFGL